MLTKLRALRAENPRLYQLGVYLFFGVLTTLVNWVVYEALKALLGLAAYPQGSPAWTLIANVCQGIAWVASVLFAYGVNRRYVFESDTRRGDFFKEMWQFISSRALGYLLFDLLLFNIFLLFMADRPAKLIMNVFVIIYNYVASRFVVFKKPSARADRKQVEESQ